MDAKTDTALQSLRNIKVSFREVRHRQSTISAYSSTPNAISARLARQENDIVVRAPAAVLIEDGPLSLRRVGSFDIAEASVARRPEEGIGRGSRPLRRMQSYAKKNVDVEGLSPRALL